MSNNTKDKGRKSFLLVRTNTDEFTPAIKSTGGKMFQHSLDVFQNLLLIKNAHLYMTASFEINETSVFRKGNGFRNYSMPSYAIGEQMKPYKVWETVLLQSSTTTARTIILWWYKDCSVANEWKNIFWIGQPASFTNVMKACGYGNLFLMQI